MDLRPYTVEDADDVAAFLASCHALDETIIAVSPDAWRGFAAMSFNRGARDFALIEDDGAIVAVLVSTRHPEDDTTLRNFRIFVHPSHRRQGLGARLLAHVEAQDPDREVTLQCSAPARWLVGSAFLEKRGFAPMKIDLEMCRRGPPPAPVKAPAGYTLRPYEKSAANDAAWIALHDDGYTATHGYTQMNASDQETSRSTPGFHLWLAAKDGEVCGLCETQPSQDGSGGLLESVVVHSAHRGRGLGRALVVAGLRTLAEQGFAKVDLGVFDDNASAKGLYHSLGFEIYAETKTYRRQRRP